MKHRMAGFQKRTAVEEARKVGLAVIRQEGNTVSCSCKGWTFTHARPSVQDKAVERHLKKRHAGRGVRL